ncbi:hypothetical protein [Streptomyces sp. NPDC052701]|uniref:hypothetical protein n=1 Tax=Streptomyces sp. NPDC052701 TaxID=3155533 RepID=UPI00343F0545
MTDHRSEAPGENGEPVPRDLPDQQVTAGEDPWEVAPDQAGGDTGARDGSAGADESDESAERAGSGRDVPDTDQAGTGRQGEARSGSVHPEQPVPDEPSD